MVALFEFKKLDISARYWVAASLLIGVTNIATVFRAELPLFVSYSLAIGGSVSAYFVMGFGIARLYTHRSAGSDWLWILSVFVVYTAAMELCRQHTNPKVTLVISSLGLGLASLWCAIPAHRHYRLTGNRFSMHMRWVVIALAFVQIARTQSLLGTWSFQSFGQDLLSLSLWTSIYILGILRYCFYVAMRIQEYANEKAAVALIQVRTEESRRVAEQLAHLARQQSLSLMGASFSHELNQPLTATLNYAELAKSQILSGKADNAILVELMDYIIEHTVRISQVIRQIRNFIRPSQYRSEHVDMSRLI